MRTLPGQVEFAKYLLSVGNGTLNDNDNNFKVPAQCITQRTDHMVETTLKELINNLRNENLAKVAVLSARKIVTMEILMM